MPLNASVAVGGNRQAGNTCKMCGYLAGECIEEGDHMRHVVIAQRSSQLEASHHTHGVVELGY